MEATSMGPPSRVVIENLKPAVNDGRFPVKRVIGEAVEVTADIFTDSHEVISAAVLFRRETDADWSETPMHALGNDVWSGQFWVDELKSYFYTVTAWIDHFKGWRRDFAKKLEAGQDVSLDLLVGARLISDAAERAQGQDASLLRTWLGELQSNRDIKECAVIVLQESLAEVADKYADRSGAACYDRELPVSVDRKKAGFSSWYEMFPRSCGSDGQRHGTLQQCAEQLDYVASMGFDVLYLPPIHPIGETKRKGKNNSTSAKKGDPGSPWAIGADQGGHKAIHPSLGSLDDLRALQDKAANVGIELALDIAFQATPDHPYVKEHPEWFRHRPDGTIQHAENPPKKYEDIYPFDFESKDWQALWRELRGVLFFWSEQGIRIFRVDNPHTKPFPFWESVIAEVRKKYPETIFLSEAFTRPKVMYRLAKVGFSQSYTYFTWRNTKHELTQYVTELTRTEVKEFFRPNFWPNTPDILPEYLQFDRREAFSVRLVLAATLSANYGIYGPAYELYENEPMAPGREEYLNSEKYEIKRWDIHRADSLSGLIARVNRIRHGNAALQSNHRLKFHDVENDQMIAYSKASADGSNVILVVVNLDPYHTQAGWLNLPLDELQIDPNQAYQVHDLLGNARFFWQGPRNFVQLDPTSAPAHIFVIRRRLRTERDFDYFM
jgi:starch synthase (maltosyl-transferring)